MAVVRSGRRIELEGSARGRPFETYEHASARYGAVPFHDGVPPRHPCPAGTPAKGAPVVFLMQGFSCASVESLRPAAPLSSDCVRPRSPRNRGVRIEKPGMGDSRGSEECSEIGLERSSALSRRAISHCRSTTASQRGRSSFSAIRLAEWKRRSSPRATLLRGASPSTASPPGTGTTMSSTSFESGASCLAGADPVERSVAAEAAREPLRRLYLQRQSPAEVAAANPEAAEMLRQTHDWDGGDHLFGRHYRFLQDLAALAQTRAWKEIQHQCPRALRRKRPDRA